MTLLFLESVGTTELLLILVAALILFGPRKLPELSRSLGKGLSEFKRASDEFKRTWEREVNLDSHERERQLADAMLPPDAPAANTIAPPALTSQTTDDAAPTIARGAEGSTGGAGAATNVAEVSAGGAPPQPRADQSGAAGSSANGVEPAPQSPHKADWV